MTPPKPREHRATRTDVGLTLFDNRDIDAAPQLAFGTDAAMWASLARTLPIATRLRTAASVQVVVASRITQLLLVDDQVRRGPGDYLRGASGRGLRV